MAGRGQGRGVAGNNRMRRDMGGGIIVTAVTLSGRSGLLLSIPNLTFTDLADGQVLVKVDGPIELHDTLADKPFVTLQPHGTTVKVSDKGGLRQYAFNAERLDLTLLNRGRGKGITLELGLKSVSAAYVEQSGDTDQVTIGLTADEVRSIGTDSSDNAAPRMQDLTLPDVRLQLQVVAPPGVLRDPSLTAEQKFQQGLTVAGSLVNGPILALIKLDRGMVNEQGLPCKITFQMDKADFAARADCGAAEMRDTTRSATDPIILTLGQVQAQVAGPVNSLTTPRNLNLLFALRDVQANAALWAMADPKSALPHEAMSLAMDLGLLTRWNVFDESAGVVYKPEAVDLRQFDLNLAGVQASFQGQGTLDPAGSADAPFSEGVLDGKVTGLNRVLNAVQDAGFVGAGDLFPLRAGMMMVFNSGTGDDVLTTHVEAKPGGSLYVNGAQIR